MSYRNADGLLLQYGTEKAIPTTGGDYCMPGELREVEIQVDLTQLTTTPQTFWDTTFFGAGMFVEQVDVVADVAAVGGTSFSVGLLGYDGTTVLSNTAFVAAGLTATMAAVGDKVILTKGSTGAGAYIGTTTATPGYISALAAGTFTAGKLTVRIRYRGVPPITE